MSRGPTHTPPVPTKPFHETGPRQFRTVAEFRANNGQASYQLAPCNGYLYALHLHTYGSFRRARLLECNGSPLVDCSQRALKLVSGNENTIPVALNDRGVGALPDMSAACGYRLDLFDATERGSVVAEYWPLPAVQDVYGNPQPRTPPYVGTTAFLNEFMPKPDPHSLLMWRTGNLISYLALILDQATFRATFTRDDTTVREIKVYPEVVELFNQTDLSAMLPTVADTLIQVDHIVPTIDPHSAPRFVIRDVATSSIL